MPFHPPGAAYQGLRPAIDEALQRVLAQGRYIDGPVVEEFEEALAAFCGTRYAVGVADGTDAMALTLQACGIGTGDELLVPGNTRPHTWIAIRQTGARPVAVDPHPESGTMDPECVRYSVGARTAAIVPAHRHGCPANVDALREVAQHHGLLLVEDAGCAVGARWGEVRVGGAGKAAVFAFHPESNLPAFGVAGAVTTNDAALAERARALRRGMSAIQACTLRVGLRAVSGWNARRRAIADRYAESFAAIPDLGLPILDATATPAWHQYVVRHEERNRLAESLRSQGIDTRIPEHTHLTEWLPVTDDLVRRSLALPVSPHLADEQIERVIAAVHHALGTRGE